MTEEEFENLKPGDIVRCTQSCRPLFGESSYTKNTLYVVKGTTSWGSITTKDNSGKDNGWAYEHFEKVGKNKKEQEILRLLFKVVE